MTEQEMQHQQRRLAQWAEMWQRYMEQGWQSIPLWKDGAPGFQPEYRQEQPRMLICPHEDETPRSIIVICAGGGFQYKTYLEAQALSDCFRAAGFLTAILDYRCLPYTQEDAMQDVKRAIRLLRYHAADWRIDPHHIAVSGFSAGGRVAALGATCYDAGDPSAADPVEQVSSRPDAAVLAYCIGSSAQVYGALHYDRAQQNINARLSPEQLVPFDAPPFFLFQTAQDDPRHALKLATALADKGIAFELHIFPDGLHGQALYDGQYGTQNIPHTAHWSHLACEWLKGLGF